MVRIVNLEAVENDPNLQAWLDFGKRWKDWRAQFNQHHWPESWQGKAYKEDQLRFPSPWSGCELSTRYSLRNQLLFGYVLQEQRQRALLIPGYLGAGHQLEAIYLIREQTLLHLPYSLADSNWFLQVTNILLPELLSRQMLNPAAKIVPLQLSIEGHPNFAHCLLNTYTCLEENKHEIQSSIKIIGIEPIAPLKDLFPEYQWLKQHEQSDGNEQEFELPISCRPSVISEGLRNRIQQYADNNHPTNQIQENTKINERIMHWKQNGGWVLWVSLKTRGAVAHGLKEFIVELIKEFESRQCTPMLILDGFSVQQGTSNQEIYYEITLQELIREEISLAAEIRELLQEKGCTTEIIEAIGIPLLSNINLAGFADFYICHQGTVQHKIGWTYWNTPGIVHSNPTRWRTGIHEWGGMGGKAPIWMKKEAITEHQDTKNQNAIHNQSPRRPYQINCQPAIKSVIESLEQSGLILEFKQVQSESVENNIDEHSQSNSSTINPEFQLQKVPFSHIKAASQSSYSEFSKSQKESIQALTTTASKNEFSFHTKSEISPSWACKFKWPIQISRITIYNRDNTLFHSRIQEIVVSVHDEYGRTRTIFSQIKPNFTGKSGGKPLQVDIEGVICCGIIIKAINEVAAPLHLQEINIFRSPLYLLQDKVSKLQLKHYTCALNNSGFGDKLLELALSSHILETVGLRFCGLEEKSLENSCRLTDYTKSSLEIYQQLGFCSLIAPDEFLAKPFRINLDNQYDGFSFTQIINIVSDILAGIPKQENYSCVQLCMDPMLCSNLIMQNPNKYNTSYLSVAPIEAAKRSVNSLLHSGFTNKLNVIIHVRLGDVANLKIDDDKWIIPFECAWDSQLKYHTDDEIKNSDRYDRIDIIIQLVEALSKSPKRNKMRITLVSDGAQSAHEYVSKRLSLIEHSDSQSIVAKAISYIPLLSAKLNRLSELTDESIIGESSDMFVNVVKKIVNSDAIISTNGHYCYQLSSLSEKSPFIAMAYMARTHRSHNLHTLYWSSDQDHDVNYIHKAIEAMA